MFIIPVIWKTPILQWLINKSVYRMNSLGITLLESLQYLTHAHTRNKGHIFS